VTNQAEATGLISGFEVCGTPMGNCTDQRGFLRGRVGCRKLCDRSYSPKYGIWSRNAATNATKNKDL